MLSAGRVLAQQHEVMVTTSNELRGMVEAAGLAFIAEPAETSTFVGKFIAAHPEFAQMPAGLEQLRFGLEHYIAAGIASQASNLRYALEIFAADIILADSFFFGTLPLLLRPRAERATIVHLGISVLNVHSGKDVPQRPGVTADDWVTERVHYRESILDPVQAAFASALHECGIRPLEVPVLESLAVLSDLYIHPGILSFDYPHDISNVHHIGRLPMASGQSVVPDWWESRDRSKRVVLVTQGTVANRDMSQLIEPSLIGLENEHDVIVIVTTGGQTLDSIALELPSNAYVETFLPFERILPFVDVLVTNGGYGTVNMALAYGVPMVVAGLSEDKEEVAAHVHWAGVGVDLHTSRAKSEAVRCAVRQVLDMPDYRRRAKEMEAEFAACDAETSLLELIGSLGGAG